MNILANNLPFGILLTGWLVVALFFILGWMTAGKPKFPDGVKILACLVMITLFWTIHAKMGHGQQEGMIFHLLGATLLTLMLGFPWALAFFTFMATCFAAIFQGSNEVAAAGLTVMVTGLPAMIITDISLKLAKRFLPHDLFVFIFVNGFFTAALGMITAGFCLVLFLAQAKVFDSHTLWSVTFPIFILLMWSEAFITGLLTSIMVAFAPQLLTEFTDEMYIQRKNRFFKDDKNEG